jgi:4-alpha-glucanotransferase
MTGPAKPLQALAELYGIQTTYEDDTGHSRQAAPEAVLAALRALGATLQRAMEAGAALRARQQALWRRRLGPVVLAWDGQPGEARLHLPAREANGALGCRLELENDEARSWSAALTDLPLLEAARVEGVGYEARGLPLPGPLPLGYHRLVVEHHGTNAEALVLSAPTRAYSLDEARTWGVFLPLYAVRSARDWGAGDFTDLEELIAWVQERGGGLAGTLPMLAAFLDEPFEPSPYSPASRLFWNEFFLDVERVPELAGNERARALLASADFQHKRAELRATNLVDYRRVMALKRRVLEELSHGFSADPGGRLDGFRRFVAAHPRVEAYAAFRAAGERRRASWHTWPERQRQGDLRPGDYDEDARDYHRYVQWLADEQLCRLAERARVKGPGLYLDLPLGANADSYDVWCERSSFAEGVSAGAPPDVFFTKGQDWGFPPLHPEHIRASGYRYLRECLHNNLRYAGMLRIDHMMGLHRFYWVPHGLGPQHGVYVRYPAEELHAVYSLESNRHKTVLVGEDLGTVPPAVRPAMARHNVHRMYVAQYELNAEHDPPLPPVYAGAVASVNTHDMPTFTAYWQALDLEDRQALGLLDEAGVENERRRRAQVREGLFRFLNASGLLEGEEELGSVLRALLQYFACGPSQVVLANLEDLWQAKDPQNVPGTATERPNWRRKAAYNLEELDAVPRLLETLQVLDRAMRQGAEKKSARPLVNQKQ